MFQFGVTRPSVCGGFPFLKEERGLWGVRSCTRVCGTSGKYILGFSGPDEPLEKREVRTGKRTIMRRGRMLRNICLSVAGVSGPVFSLRGRRCGLPPPNW